MRTEQKMETEQTQQTKAYKINILVNGNMLTYTCLNYTKDDGNISFYDKFGNYVEYEIDDSYVKLISIEQINYKGGKNGQ